MDKNNQNISKSANCSLKLIRQAADEGWMRQLAFFHCIKSSFGNSVVFNYKSRMPEIAEKFNISLQTCYTYIGFLRSHALIFIFEGNKNNLSLKSIAQIRYGFSEKKKCKITINSKDTIIYKVACRLYCKLIEDHIRKMAFAKALKEFGGRNLNKLTSGEVASPPLFSLSIRSIAKILNLNERTVIRLLKTLEKLGIIKIHPQKPVKISESKLDLNTITDYPGYRFVTSKGTFLQFGHKIELLEFPVKMPKMTYEKYLKIYKSNKSKKYNIY